MLLQFLQPLPQPDLVGLAQIGGRVCQLCDWPYGRPRYPLTMVTVVLGGGSITLFHIRGIRISVDWSWFIILFLVIFWMSNFYDDTVEATRRDRPTAASSLAVASADRLLRLDPPARARPRPRHRRRNGIGISSHPAVDLRRHGADGPRSRFRRGRSAGRPRRAGGDPALIFVVLHGRGRRHRGRLARVQPRGADRVDLRRLRRPRGDGAGSPRSTCCCSSSTCCRRSRWTAAASPGRSPGGVTGDRNAATKLRRRPRPRLRLRLHRPAASAWRLTGAFLGTTSAASGSPSDRADDQRRRQRRLDADPDEPPGGQRSRSPT